jgi:arsenite-transporting ATPase
MTAKIQFFIGKGGVGKSTTSALTALQLAHRGRSVLLVSMDPAHNLRDIFQRRFSEKPRQVMPGLAVIEVDSDHWTTTYLKQTQSELKKVYRYQSAFNIQNCYDILKYSPGLEEHALLLAFENILHTFGNHDDILFDMPPTALTMRFISLPLTTLVWLEELLRLRKQIYAKKEIISKIKLGNRVIEQDKVKARLESLITAHAHLRDHFTAGTTAVNLVLNNDRLSFSEARRIRRKLADIGIPIAQVLVNKVVDDKRAEAITRTFTECPIRCFSLSAGDLYGLDALNTYIRENPVLAKSYATA